MPSHRCTAHSLGPISLLGVPRRVRSPCSPSPAPGPSSSTVCISGPAPSGHHTVYEQRRTSSAWSKQVLSTRLDPTAAQSTIRSLSFPHPQSDALCYMLFKSTSLGLATESSLCISTLGILLRASAQCCISQRKCLE